VAQPFAAAALEVGLVLLVKWLIGQQDPEETLPNALAAALTSDAITARASVDTVAG